MSQQNQPFAPGLKPEPGRGLSSRNTGRCQAGCGGFRLWLGVLFVVVWGVSAHAAPTPRNAEALIPWSQLGTQASQQYGNGQALGVAATPEGARLHTDFQRLQGEVTAYGLRLESTTDAKSREHFSLRAQALGREQGETSAFARTGRVEVDGNYVRWLRPGVVEEYSVSVDGVRQDFVLSESPVGTGDLVLELALEGARAETAADKEKGVRLILDGSGRALAYNRLKVWDAEGRVLPAQLRLVGADGLTIAVNDAGAVWPIRIDPTFSDGDWAALGAGVNHNVFALALDGSGGLYVGGAFTQAGGAAASLIAHWDGSSWSPLGAGLEQIYDEFMDYYFGQVNALAVDGAGGLYAGGNFAGAEGVANTEHFAYWNGTTWSAVGTGVNRRVNALVLDGAGGLYVAGDFTNGEVGNRIAHWNGTDTWTALGTGLNQFVNALVLDGTGGVYAAGNFTSAGGVSAVRIAHWNGTNTWTALGSGLDGVVRGLAPDGVGGVYAGGDFTNAGTRIAHWDGIDTWSALSAGVNGTVVALEPDGSGGVYAGGFFTDVGNYIAHWNGTNTWSNLGSSGLDSSVFVLTLDGGGGVYVGGGFSTAGGQAAANVAHVKLPAMAINAGNNQSATAGDAVATPPSVLVLDANNNPVSGDAVTFAVASGGGTVNPTTAVTTDANGIATVTSWTLGTAVGENTLTATSAGLTGSPVTFTASALAIVALADVGSGGSMTPASQEVASGDTASFTLTPDDGHVIGTVSGCAGSLNGTTYTTGELSANCTVTASFIQVAISGSGSDADPFVINDGADLSNIGDHLDSHFKLVGDGAGRLDVGADWVPIGSAAVPFTGSIASQDGQPVAIAGLNGKPLFDVVGEGAEVSDLVIENSVNAAAGSHAGLLANVIQGSVTNPAVLWNITIDSTSSITGIDAIGGLAGTIDQAQLSGVTVNADVDGTSQVGGVGGTIANSSLDGIAVNGAVSSDLDRVGGIGGRLTDTQITGSEVNGPVSGGNEVGGVGGNITGGRVSETTVSSSVDGTGADVGPVGGLVDNTASIELTITVTSGANGIVSPTSAVVESGGTAGFTVTPDANYSIGSVTGCGDGILSGGTYTTGTITQNCQIAASFVLNQYDLTYSAGANGSIDGTSPQTVVHGSDGASVTAVPDLGYHFSGWSDGSTVNPRTETNVTGSITLEAAFAINQYDLTYSAGSNGSIVGISSQTVAHGSDGDAVTAVPVTGYSFLKWSDGVTANPRSDTGVTGPVTASASFVVNQYSLTFDSQGGDPVATSTQDFDSQVTVPAAPNREGYTFAGWNTVAGGSGTAYAQGSIFAMPAGGLTLYAQWTVNAYTLSFNSDGGSGSAVTNISQDFGTSVTAPSDPTRDGYTFAGWSPTVPATMPSEDVTLTAQWTVNAYTLSFDSAGGSEVTNISQDFGTSVTAPSDPTREGYTFSGWSPAVPATMPSEDQALTAQWDNSIYTVSATALEGGSISPDSTTVTHGETAEFSVEVNGGFLFDQVTGCGSTLSDKTLTTIAVTEDCTIEVSFERVASDGQGTEQDPFVIMNGADLANIADHSDSHFVLDVGANGTLDVGANWSPLGSAVTPFVGSIASIDGKPVKLSGLGGQPVFGEIGPGATVSDLTIQGSQNLDAGDNAGLLAKVIKGSAEQPVRLDNILIDSTSRIDGGDRVGAIAGTLEHANLNQVTVDAEVNGANEVGGVAGRIAESTLKESRINGDVSGSGDQVGGIGGSINNAFVSGGLVNGDVSGNNQVGGIGGSVTGSSLVNSAVNGIVSGNGSSVDAIAGTLDDGSSIANVSSGSTDEKLEPFGRVLFGSDGVPLGDGSLATGEEVRIVIEGAVLPLSISGTVTRGIDVFNLDSGTQSGIVLTDRQGGNPVLTFREGDYFFSAGRGGAYELVFEDRDSEAFTIAFDVRPQVAFSSTRQLGTGGTQVTVRAVLEGTPGQYPVRVPYAVVGHDLLDSSDLNAQGAFEFTADGPQARVRTLNLTPAGDVGAVAITLLQGSGPEDALLGNPSVHRIVLRQAQEVPLFVTLGAQQRGQAVGALAESGNDPVTLTAQRPDTGEAYSDANHVFDWSESALELGIVNQTTASVQIDPSHLSQGQSFLVRVAVTETGTANTGTARRASAQMRLRFIGQGDGDALDAFAGFLDADPERSHRLPICPQGVDVFRDPGDRTCNSVDRSQRGIFLEAPEGYTVNLGSMAEQASWATRDFGLEVDTDEIRDGSGATAINARDTEFTHLGFRVDFEISDLEYPGQSVPVVIPLPAGEAIPADAVWRKYLRGGWRTFVENEANELFSARVSSDFGECPWPGSDRWTPGLTEGDNCVRLVIQDGGPNDFDGETDGVIRDPGTLAVASSADGGDQTGENSGSQTLKSNGGGGGLSSMGVMLFVLGALVLLRHRRSIALMALVMAGSAQADPETSWYVGAQWGYGMTDVSSSDINDRLAREGIAGSARVSDSDRPGVRAFIGYQWHEFVGLEAGFVDLGEITTRFSGTEPTLRASDLEDVRPGSGRGVEASLVGRYPLAANWHALARVGLLRWRTGQHLEGAGADTSNGNDALFGLGMDYRFHEFWSARLSVDRYRVENDETDFIGFGVSYHFGGN